MSRHRDYSGLPGLGEARSTQGSNFLLISAFFRLLVGKRARHANWWTFQRERGTAEKGIITG
jgi:hypothetical protein